MYCQFGFPGWRRKTYNIWPSSIRKSELVVRSLIRHVSLNTLPNPLQRDLWFQSLALYIYLTSLDTSGSSERAEFWRAYTASLLYQNHEVKERLKDVDIISSDLCVLFSKVQEGLPLTVASHMNSFREYLHCSMDLAAQLRCQRGVYEVDEIIKLADRYDDGRMVDLDNPDLKDSEDADRAFVSGIMSKGVVRKAFAGATEQTGWTSLRRAVSNVVQMCAL
jgi:hypothetical protein